MLLAKPTIPISTPLPTHNMTKRQLIARRIMLVRELNKPIGLTHEKSCYDVQEEIYEQLAKVNQELKTYDPLNDEMCVVDVSSLECREYEN